MTSTGTTVNNNIIIEAKNQYTLQLIDTLAPYIFSGLKSIHVKCSSLKKFQEELTNIPKWNKLIIENEYDRVVKYSKCDWLDKLIESVFVCNVKILTAINADNDSVFQIKVPDTKDFLHACYVESARNLFVEPHLIKDDEHNKNMKMCIETIGKSIEKTIHHFIPKQEIIEQCLNAYKNEQETGEEEDDSGAESDNEQEEFEQKDEFDEENNEDELKIDNDGYKSINEHQADVLMNEPKQPSDEFGQPDLVTSNEPPILPEDSSPRQETLETMQIPTHNVKQHVHEKEDYFFSSDSD